MGQAHHPYILTFPDCVIPCYKTLDPTNPLESKLITLLTPNVGEDFNLNYIPAKYKQYLKNEIIDMEVVSKEFFYEKLHSLANNPNMKEEDIIQRTLSFDNNKGFEVNRGSYFYNLRQFPQNAHDFAKSSIA